MHFWGRVEVRHSLIPHRDQVGETIQDTNGRIGKDLPKERRIIVQRVKETAQ